MAALTLELCSAEHPPVDVDAVEITIPGAGGVFTVLPGHTPLLTTLTEGVVVAYRAGGEREYFAVHGGFCEVADNKVTILADVMETRGAIDEARARAALQRAEERLEKPAHDLDVARAEAAMARARARLEARSMSD